jgi:PAS domain S-box-containing protein
MHPYVFIPLASMIGAGILASAIAAREPDQRANRLVGLVLLSVGFWSMCDFLRNLSPTPERALFWLRFSTLGAVLLGPLALHNLIVHRAEGTAPFRRLLPLAYGGALVAAAVGGFTDWLIADVERTEWGWASVMGPALAPTYAVVAALPSAAVVAWLAKRRFRIGDLPRGMLVFLLGGAACFITASLTDFVFPLVDVAFPRLGSASIVVWGGFTWWSIYRVREPTLAPHRYAREILETLPDGIALVRLDGRVRITNDKLAELVGLPREQIMGRPIEELLAEIPSEAGKAGVGAESELITDSGRRVPVSVRRTPLVDAEGHLIGEILVVRDMREVVSIRSRLVASGRLVAVGQLAAGIAHEINNPIAYVRANLGLLESDWKSLAGALAGSPHGPLVRKALDEGPELIGESARGVDRIAGIVREVGGFSRGGVVEEERAKVSDLVATAIRVAAPQLRGIRVERSLDDLPGVRCVPQEIVQVFLNLLVNASQAMEGEGWVRIEGRVRPNEVWVDVTDSGPGIDPALQRRIFEPFFTTKPAGEGTGLGLSISRQIVVNHGGFLELEDPEDGGTCFRVRLPLPENAETEVACTPSS